MTTPTKQQKHMKNMALRWLNLSMIGPADEVPMTDCKLPSPTVTLLSRDLLLPTNAMLCIRLTLEADRVQTPLALHSPKRATKPGMACTPPNIPVSVHVRSTILSLCIAASGLSGTTYQSQR
jgi:hypothetical protein